MAAKKTTKKKGSQPGGSPPQKQGEPATSTEASSTQGGGNKDGAKKSAGAKKAGGAAAVAEEIVADEAANKRVAEYGGQLLDERATTATQAARVLSEITTRKPELVVSLVDKFVAGLTSDNKRVVQASADALPAIARVAPARVARHLDKLKAAFDRASDVGKDGEVRTFAALCTASVAYQKRLEPVLTKALHQAQGKTLLRWTEIVLPSLKGEPHARARAVVEQRLYKIPRSVAQPIADFLGIKLRPNVR